MTESVNQERVGNFVYVRMAKGTKNDSLVYLFGCYVFYWGGGYNGDSLTGKESCWKIVDNLSLMSCRKVIASESQDEWYEEIVNGFGVQDVELPEQVDVIVSEWMVSSHRWCS